MFYNNINKHKKNKIILYFIHKYNNLYCLVILVNTAIIHIFCT